MPAAVPQHVANATRRGNARFAKAVLLTNGLVPLALLIWDAYHRQLGVNGVNYALHTTGLVSLLFLTATLLVTPLRKLTGWNVLISFRRALGLFAFFYACLHLAIFALFDRAGSLSSTWHEIVNRRYLQIGTAGLLAMLPLAITSTNAMVMRLGAKRWKALHRLAYLAAIAGAVHYLLLVKSDLRQPAVFAAILALLLVYRLLNGARDRKRPLSPSPRQPRPWTGDLVVTNVIDETPDVRTFHLAAVDGGDLPFAHQPGQYLNVALMVGGRRVNRSYTIASSPACREHCEITVKRVQDGYASHHLHDVIRVGDRLRISAPAGRFVFDGREAHHVVLVAGGVGITPLMAMVRHLTGTGWSGSIHLFFSVRRPNDIIFREELALLVRQFPNLHLHLTLTQEHGPSWDGRRGRIDADWLAQTVPHLRSCPVFVCGPSAMNTDLPLRLVADHGLASDQVRTENFVSTPVPSDDQVAAGSPSNDPMLTTPAAPTAPSTTKDSPSPGMVSVEFLRAGRRVAASTEVTLLEVAEGAGLELPYECRAGICGQCKTRLASGRVRMDVEDALTARDKALGLVLLCQAHPLDDIVLDA